MPPIRSLAFKYHIYIVAVILLLSEIIPSCSYYKEKKLVYIIITAPFSCQPSFYIKYTKLNIYLSCNVKSVSNAEYIFIFLYNIHSLSQLLNRNIWGYTAFLALHYIL